MTKSPRSLTPVCLTLLVGGALVAAQQQPSDRLSGQRTEVDLSIGDRIGAPPRFAVPDCLVPRGEPDLVTVGQTIAQVLWDDLEFEREFRMLAPDTYDTVPRSRTLTDLPFDAWRELGADGVVSCTVSALPNDQIRVQARLFNVRSLESAFGVEYTGSIRNTRVYAHQLSDEIHRQQRGLEGIARTHIAFVSDRDSESVLGLVEKRQTKEVYNADYDGANVRRVTVGRSLNITPAWAPNGRSIAYTTYRDGPQDVAISHIYEGRLEAPLGGSASVHNWLPAYSPDGRQVAFNSNRDGNPETRAVGIQYASVPSQRRGSCRRVPTPVARVLSPKFYLRGRFYDPIITAAILRCAVTSALQRPMVL